MPRQSDRGEGVGTGPSVETRARAHRETLDAWVREVISWHFDPATGTPFWLEFAKAAGWDPPSEVQGYADLARFDPFQDEWLRGGPVRQWVPRGYADRPVYIFETGGSTGVPKARINIEDFRRDYELFSSTLPDASFPKGADWLQVGLSGPRRLRLAVEHLCQFRGGICFMVDLDPRWVVKLVKGAVPAALGPSLAVTVLSEDPVLHRRVLGSPLLQRLNFGPLPTWQVSWDQPHEGNLFEHLWAQRALQTFPGAA